MMRKTNIILIIAFSLSGCTLNTNVCPTNLEPVIVLENYKALETDSAKLLEVDSRNTKTKVFPFKYVNISDEKSYFVFEGNKIHSNKVYKFEHNALVYYIHSIDLNKSSKPQNCGLYNNIKINECESESLLYFQESCGIPVSQADKYFENKVKSSM